MYTLAKLAVFSGLYFVALTGPVLASDVEASRINNYTLPADGLERFSSQTVKEGDHDRESPETSQSRDGSVGIAYEVERIVSKSVPDFLLK